MPSALAPHGPSSDRVSRFQGTILVSVIVVVWRAVTVTSTGADHCGRLVPLVSTSMMLGERSETWYRPTGSSTENTPELLVRTRTGK